MISNTTIKLPCGHSTYAQVNEYGTLLSDTHICKVCGKKFNLEFNVWKETSNCCIQVHPHFIK